MSPLTRQQYDYITQYLEYSDRAFKCRMSSKGNMWVTQVIWSNRVNTANNICIYFSSIVISYLNNRWHQVCKWHARVAVCTIFFSSKQASNNTNWQWVHSHVYTVHSTLNMLSFLPGSYVAICPILRHWRGATLDFLLLRVLFRALSLNFTPTKVRDKGVWQCADTCLWD